MTTAKVRNDRLAEAMVRAGMTSADLAELAAVDPRTVDRLIADDSRIPRATTRHLMAEALRMPAGYFWPTTTNGTSLTGELLAAYPSRSAVPTGLVMSLLSDVHERVDVLALAAVWLWDAIPDFGSTLAAKAEAGVAIRICLGDPSGESVRIRGREEGIDDLLSARARLALTYARRSLGAGTNAVRLHDTTLYASILRFDDELLVNWHLYGVAAADAPVLHLRRTSSCGLAESVSRSFERVWELAQPAG